MDAQVKDLSALSDQEIGELTTEFVQSWNDLDPSSRILTDDLARIAAQELRDAGFAAPSPDDTLYDQTRYVYHPQLKALMLLGGGPDHGEVVDESGHNVPGALTTYFEPVEGSWELTPEGDKVAAEKGFNLTSCSPNHMIRTAPGHWTVIANDSQEAYKFHVAVRDVTSDDHLVPDDCELCHRA